MMQGKRSVWGKIAAVAAAVAVMCIPAQAQMGMGAGDFTQFVAPVTKKAINNWAQMVGMDKDQKDLAMTLQEGYRTQHKAVMEEFQKLLKEAGEKVQESGDFMSMQKEMAKLGKDFTDKMEKLEKGLLDDIKALLNEKQTESWPRVERARRRDNGLRLGFMAGQNVDLLKMLQAAQVSPESSPELMEQVTRYEGDMDRAIQDFEKWGKDQQAKQADMKPEDMMNPASWQAILKEMGDVSKAMRDVNRQYAKSMSALLPSEKQEKFDLEFKRKCFPRVYREAYVQRAMGEASRFSDLTAEQKESIESMKLSYARDAEGLNKTWAAAIEAKEEKHGGSIGAMMSGMMGGGGDKDEVGEARKARKELDQKTKDRLLAMLKDDQKSRLPEDKPEPRDGGMNFGFDIDPPDVDEE